MPPGFHVQVFARNLMSPRSLAVAPNGDVYVVESYQGRIWVLTDADGDGVSERRTLFAKGLRLPFGIAFHGSHLWVANTDSLVRFSYKLGQKRAAGNPQIVTSGIPSRGYRQHWTRNLAFDPDGRSIYLTVGSESDKSPEPPPRATILRMNLDGSGRQVFASGLRNPVGIAFRPGTSELWATCVERDFYGDDLVPDFVTRVKDGDFFGWPFFYIGRNRDPFLATKKAPDRDVQIPDVLVKAHSVPLGLVFYTGSQFPPEYRGDAFVAMRGSNNRSRLSGYMVARIDFRNGRLVPGYEHFMTGWAPNPSNRHVLGRPTGLAQTPDGALLIADEGGHKVWRITYQGVLSRLPKAPTPNAQ